MGEVVYLASVRARRSKRHLSVPPHKPELWPQHLRHAIPRMAAYYEREFVLAGAFLHVSAICAQAQRKGLPPRTVSADMPNARKELGLWGPVTEYDLALAAIEINDIRRFDQI